MQINPVMKLRAGEPWISAPQYGRSLKALTINLLVKNIDAALEFQTRVLQAQIVYSDPDIAVLEGYGAEWMLHADHTYTANPLRELTDSAKTRGIGVEIRLHGCDPDQAAARAKKFGFMVFADAKDKPHGLREAYLMDCDGYMWVVDIPIFDDAESPANPD